MQFQNKPSGGAFEDPNEYDDVQEEAKKDKFEEKKGRLNLIELIEEEEEKSSCT